MGRSLRVYGGRTVDKGSIQRIVQQYRSPYTAVGWAFVKALRIRPRPPLPSSGRRRNRGQSGSGDDIEECRRQRHGVEM